MHPSFPHSLQQANTSSPLSRVDPNNMALLVVDMQYFDAHPEWGEGRTAIEIGVADVFAPYFAQIDDIIPPIQGLLSLFRHKEMEVVHVRVAERTRDSRDVGRKQLVRGLVVPSDSKEAEPLVEVAPMGDELVISKSSSGVFATTNIDRLLRNLGINTLLFTGTATGGCIESAVRDAIDLGYQVILVSDACADSTADSHEAALQRMEGGLVQVMTTDQVKKMLTPMANGNGQSRSGLERVKPYLPKPPKTPPGPEVNPYSLIFPPAVELSISKENFAFVVMDAQCFACDPDCAIGQIPGQASTEAQRLAYYERVQSAISNIAMLLERCRCLDLPVIHVRTAAQMSNGRDLSHHLRLLEITPFKDSMAAAFMTEVEPTSEELVLDKPGLGIFTGTGLDERLRNLDVEQLILTGISFAGGLEGSIRSASDRGYSVVLVPDACATFDESAQKKLSGMESGIINVRSAERLSAQLQELG